MFLVSIVLIIVIYRKVYKMSDTQNVPAHEGNLIADLEMVKEQLIEINAQLGELTQRKKRLLEMTHVAQELTIEILALGDKKLGVPIDELEFPNSSRIAVLTALRANNIKTLGDFENVSEESLSKTPTLAKAIDDIKLVLAKHGLELK